MSDIYGMSNALKGYLNHLDECSRGTGRTNKMLEMVQDGDLIVCHSARETQRLRRACQMQGKVVRTVCGSKEKVFERISGLVSGNVHFDHEWVRQSLLESIYQEEDFIRDMKVLCESRGGLSYEQLRTS